MKNTVKLVLASNRECFPDKATHDQYTCRFELKGRQILIDSSGTYRECGLSDIRKVDAMGGEHGTHIPMQITFSKQKMAEVYEFEDNESSPDYIASHDGNIKNIVEKFWGRNPICTVNGKAHENCKSESFYDLIDMNAATLKKVKSFDDIVRAAAKLKDCSFEELKEISFYYNLHPEGKSKEVLLVDLGDFDTGHCLRDNNIAEFLRVWVDGKSDEKQILIVFRKAVDFEIIANKKTEDRNNYYLGESYLGGDENSFIDWARKNDREYQEHIVKKISEHDKKSAGAINSIAVNAETKVDLKSLEILRDEARELKKQGFIYENANVNMNWDKLKILVEEGRKKKSAASKPAAV